MEIYIASSYYLKKTELEKVTLFKRLNKFLLIVNIFFCFYSKLKSKIFLPQHYQLELHFS
mgnify:CR=1 FL=1